MSLLTQLTPFLIDPPQSLLPKNYGSLVPAPVSIDSAFSVNKVSGTERREGRLKNKDEDEFRVVTISKSSYLESKLNLSSSKDSELIVPVEQQQEPDYAKMSVKELRDLCKSKKLKTTGKRPDLTLRLRSGKN